MAKRELVKKDGDGVGLNVSWSLKGISARIKSRFVSSADQLGATHMDERGLEAERRVAVHRANTDARLEIIAAATQAITGELKNDPEKASRALAVLLREEHKLENVEACLGLALEDLTNRPGLSEASDDTGPDDLNPDFVDRWGSYAEGANTEEARERWGRILAGEIRTPGTFSMKTLRVMDELGSDLAAIFHRLCELRVGAHGAPVALADLSPRELETLEEADLVQPSVLGRYTELTRAVRGDGKEIYMYGSSDAAWAVDVEEVEALKTKFKRNEGGMPYLVDGGLVLPVIGFTAAGRAIATIVSAQQGDNVLRLADLLARRLSLTTLVIYRPVGRGWNVDQSWVNPALNQPSPETAAGAEATSPPSPKTEPPDH